jgi:hypothetical protein
MIWHVVRFDFAGVDDATRAEVEASLAALDGLDEVAWLRVGRDLEEPTVTGLLTAFADEQALAAYRVHPRHVPVVQRIRELGVAVTRLDVTTDDDPAALP